MTKVLPTPPKPDRRIDFISVAVLVVAVIAVALVAVGMARSGTTALALVPPVALAVWAAVTIRQR